MSDLWTEAAFSHEAAAREAALARAEAELAGVFPFLAAARSMADYGHRRALAGDRLEAIALRCGADPAEIYEMADRHFALFREAMGKQALPEGGDPLDQVLQGPAGGSGPERPDAHSEGPDFSGGYAEIPPGAPGGPPAQVTVPVPAVPQRPEEVTASARRTAQPQPAYSTLPAGTGAGTAAGVTSPDGTGPGGVLPPARPVPMAAGGAPGRVSDVSPGDPYNLQVTSVSQAVLASNPHLGEREARRVARKAVARYLRADLDSSVTSDDYGGGDGNGGGRGGGMSGLEEYGLGRALISKIPGGAAGGLLDAGELAAL